MMVASLDPVGHTVSLLSLPRDLIDLPKQGFGLPMYGAGTHFGSK
jgi:hypothetical protein